MNLNEAILKARLDRKPCFIIEEGGNYSVVSMDMPDDAMYFHLGGEGLPRSITAEGESRLRALIKNVIYGRSVRVPGKKIKRRTS